MELRLSYTNPSILKRGRVCPLSEMNTTVFGSKPPRPWLPRWCILYVQTWDTASWSSSPTSTICVTYCCTKSVTLSGCTTMVSFHTETQSWHDAGGCRCHNFRCDQFRVSMMAEIAKVTVSGVASNRQLASKQLLCCCVDFCVSV